MQNPLNEAFLETIYRTGDIGYFNENNDLIVSNTQIKDTNELDLWTRFDKLQEEIGSSITKTDKIDLSKFSEIEKLMNQNPKLKN